MDTKMGALQLGGLIAGAVLGSGVILLPPMAHEQLGEWAVAAWIIIMAFGAVFATIFAKLAHQYPGGEGVPIAIRKAFGAKAGRLASTYLLCAVCVGPIAVLMTAAATISQAFNMPASTNEFISGVLLLGCAALLTRRISFVGSVALIASSIIGLILTASSIATILHHPVLPMPESSVNIQSMGETLLLLFWAIIGWEVVGNYTMDVRNPDKTIPRATLIAVGIISSVYGLVAWAMTALSPTGGTVAVTDVVNSLLGNAANFVVMITTTVLCVCTYLMIIGAVIRLIASLAEQNSAGTFLARRNTHGAPVTALLTLVVIQSVSLLLLQQRVLSLEDCVAIANAFFLANALLGIGAAIRLLPSRILQLTGAMLAVAFMTLLSFSSIWVLILLSCITFLVIGNPRSLWSTVLNK
ncbi:amino acid permease [Halodesulfovibrio sp.]|jgi:APA family basic amino acid/polyamine antiporter|uniref:APC family permease n=1 Tax=Halodesulfovibrio sp. TaxID=1912772 RepID=UPI0025E894BF|nr:amino acid permease [Halodesulfovibrio sp.]MCT4626489.1 amino acid permease [Halodesulfovibrio sp.]